MALFGNKKREQEAAAAAAAEQRRAQARKEQREAEDARYQERERRTKEALEIGRTGSLAAFSKAWTDPQLFYALKDGAFQALVKDNHPQNLQYALATPSPLLLEGSKAEDSSTSTINFIATVCIDLVKEGKDIAQSVGFIKSALEKVPEKEKQAALDEALFTQTEHPAYGSFNSAYQKDEAIVDILLQAGANANTHNGRALAMAIVKYPPTVIKLFRDRGAEYKDALLIMQAERWQSRYGWSDCLEKLRAYQEYDNNDRLERMEQKIDQLRAELAEARQEITGIRAGKTSVILKAPARTPPQP